MLVVMGLFQAVAALGTWVPSFIDDRVVEQFMPVWTLILRPIQGEIPSEPLVRALAAVSGVVGSIVNLTDFADRPPRALQTDETFCTDQHRFRYRPTPHLPHGWDAGVLFEETRRILFCSDLFTHNGDVEPLTESDILGRTRQSLKDFQAGPLMDYMPYTPNTRILLEDLAGLGPRTLATMHGSSFTGDGAKALLELDGVMKEMLGAPRR